jgi:8-oxo-dGTP diphosphatase
MALALKHIEVVAGLIYRDGRLLACQRHESAAFPLKWEFPGGKVEVGESDVDALRRELREELGIAVRDTKQIFQHKHVYPDGPEVSLRFFRILSHDGVMRNLVFQRIEWVELVELEQLDFLEGDRPLIRRLVAAGSAALLS